MSADHDELVGEFLRLREASDAENPGARYAALLAKLDAQFWKLVHAAVQKALDSAGEELAFAPPERLLLDAGLLDVNLVARAGRDFLEKLAAEINFGGGGEGLLYLSEWLSARFRTYLTTRTLPDARVAESILLKAAADLDAELVKAHQQRDELYRRVAGLFSELPGISPELSAAMVRGAVDDRIEELLLAEVLGADAAGQGEAEAGRQARRYDQAAQKVLRLARERAAAEDDLLYLDTISRLRLAIFRKSAVRARRARAQGAAAAEVPVESRPAPAPALEEVRTFMRHELRLVRSLLRIGSQEGRVALACSVLLLDGPRTTKPAAAAVLELVREVDPGIGLAHNVLIAPFTGSGFFEWDRDSLVVALTPARSVEEAVVNAVANFRLLADVHQGQGRLTAAYRQLHGAEFRERFLEDYRAWVLRAGRGRREALGEQTFNFFVEHIGPAAGGPVVPAEMARLSVAEREGEVRRLEGAAARAGARELHRLAVLYWQAERIDEAIRAMERAAAAAPEDGRVLYSLGLLCRRRRLSGKARAAFRGCVQVAPNTLWAIYAHEALRRMG